MDAERKRTCCGDVTLASQLIVSSARRAKAEIGSQTEKATLQGCKEQ